MKMAMVLKEPLCQSEGSGITSPQVLMQEWLNTLNLKCVLCVYDLDEHVISTQLIYNQHIKVCLCLHLVLPNV